MTIKIIINHKYIHENVFQLVNCTLAICLSTIFFIFLSFSFVIVCCGVCKEKKRKFHWALWPFQIKFDSTPQSIFIFIYNACKSFLFSDLMLFFIIFTIFHSYFAVFVFTHTEMYIFTQFPLFELSQRIWFHLIFPIVIEFFIFLFLFQYFSIPNRRLCLYDYCRFHSIIVFTTYFVMLWNLKCICHTDGDWKSLFRFWNSTLSSPISCDLVWFNMVLVKYFVVYFFLIDKFSVYTFTLYI